MPKSAESAPLPYEEEALAHPGIDPATGHERSALQILGGCVKQWRQEGILDPELPKHDTRHDPARDGWSVE